jgi:hypothetical protein
MITLALKGPVPRALKLLRLAEGAVLSPEEAEERCP